MEEKLVDTVTVEMKRAFSTDGDVKVYQRTNFYDDQPSVVCVEFKDFCQMFFDCDSPKDSYGNFENFKLLDLNKDYDLKGIESDASALPSFFNDLKKAIELFKKLTQEELKDKYQGW